jgi:hypothetical protein
MRMDVSMMTSVNIVLIMSNTVQRPAQWGGEGERVRVRALRGWGGEGEGKYWQTLILYHNSTVQAPIDDCSGS